MIPKIVHYCWLSNDPVPEELQIYMKSWKEKLPDYEFINGIFQNLIRNHQFGWKKLLNIKNMHLHVIISEFMLYIIMEESTWIWIWKY